MNIEVKNLTDMFHITVILEDTFSFAKLTKNVTVSGQTLLKMKEQINTIVINKFNPKTHIREIYKLIEIKRA